MKGKKKEIIQKEPTKKRGLPPGRTNNPKGRPIGSKNVVSAEIKEIVAGYIYDNFSKFEYDMERLESKPEIRAKLFLETVKLITPRSLADGKKGAISTQSLLFMRLSHQFDDDED